jgi:shikimate dehydrogenase
LPLRYEALDVPPESLDTTLDELIAIAAAGNVTIPHKERVAARCVRLSPLAERVGAVNTFWIETGELVGDNTDVGGFRHLLTTTAPKLSREQPVAVLGAGGSAAAVLVALDQETFRDVRVHARTSARADALCARVGIGRSMVDLHDALRGAELVVNTTPVGLDGHAIAVDLDRVEKNAVILDLVFGRNETPLVRTARARGHAAADGLAMLLEQGALAFERWFGIAPDREAMRESVAR